jgi:Ser/Thr protein kinase RdoA (MazF antagonist)
MTDPALAASRLWFVGGEVEPLGDGHIHATFVVRCPSGRYVLQQINETVFQDVERLTEQIRSVLLQWSQQTEYVVPAQIQSLRGNLLEAAGGKLWRVWPFVGDSQVIDPLVNIAQAEAAGLAFARFQQQLADLTPVPKETITGFLQLDHYLAAYHAVADHAPRKLDRLVRSNLQLADTLGTRNAIIHGDCKVNNLLFDTNGERVVAVIDFDTVMFGHWAWDFGDLVRSICYSRGALDDAYFQAALRGFSQGQPQCNPDDCVAAPQYVALMLGIRFLTDHLNNDEYFRVAVRGDNLRRAEAQFELFSELQQCEPRWRELAEDVLK